MQKESGLTSRPWRDKRILTHCKRMSTPNSKVLFDSRVARVLSDQGFNWVENPRSVYDPNQLYQALDRYGPESKPVVKHNECIKSGIALAYRVFAKPQEDSHLLPLSITKDEVVDLTSNPKGSAGLTAFGQCKKDALDLGIMNAIKISQGQKVPEPCLAFKRTQFNNKTRLIWGYPYSMTILEGLFARPLIDHYLAMYSPMVFGLPSGVIGARLRSSSYFREYAYSLDMSSFDSSVDSSLILTAFNILSTWFDLEQVEPTTGVSYADLWQKITYYFIHTPIVMPNSRVYYGKQHGVPSGSYFTQFIDSIVNTIVAGAVSSKFHLNVSADDIYVLGDDLLLWSDRAISLDKIAGFVKGNFGIKVHGSEKSGLTRFNEPLHFLGRCWVNGFPTATEGDVISRMVFPETYRRYSKDPVEAKAQAQLVMLSMAATYREGWRIATRCYSGSRMGPLIPPVLTEALPCKVNREEVYLNSLTGSQRYRLRYSFRNQLAKTVALQYWL